jgi:hypothetical protein
LSSLIVGVSAALSMIVLAAYLSVFDWNLIWLVEYSDITKLLLIGAALISSFASTLIYQTQDVYRWIVQKSAWWKKLVLFGALLSLAINGYVVYLDIQALNGHETYHIFRAMSFLFLLFLIYYLLRDIEEWKKGNWIAVTSQIASFMFFLGIVGATYGYYVKDVSSYARDIVTKSEVFQDVKLVMLLSHHVAFLVDKRVVVVPTSDITKIISRSTELTAKK